MLRPLSIFLQSNPPQNKEKNLLLWFILVDFILERILRRAVQEQIKKMSLCGVDQPRMKEPAS